MAEAVVFDLDGVLVDSEGIWTAAERATVEGLGRNYTTEIRRMLHGRGQREGARIIATMFGHTDAEAIADTLLGHGLEGLRRGVDPIPGARRLVSALRGRVPLGVASGSPRVVVETELLLAGFGHVFDVIVSGEDAPEAKPAPDPYLVACQRIGSRMRGTIAVEDSPAGVASAKAAGLVVVGLAAVPDVRLDEADIVVHHLGELRADDLIGPDGRVGRLLHGSTAPPSVSGGPRRNDSRPVRAAGDDPGGRARHIDPAGRDGR